MELGLNMSVAARWPITQIKIGGEIYDVIGIDSSRITTRDIKNEDIVYFSWRDLDKYAWEGIWIKVSNR
jgi:hypothetical protein